MIRLRDSVIVNVPPERVWAWLNALPEHYREWHPAHVLCRYERGKCLEAGAVLYVEEQLHHRLHRLHLRATEVVPGRLLRYRTRGMAGAFLLEPSNGATRFTAELAIGTALPVIGDLADAILQKVLARRLAAFQAHMSEEGAALKRLLEAEAARPAPEGRADPRD
jgi:uncharacterized protein YndB with AHSA1/START domain